MTASDNSTAQPLVATKKNVESLSAGNLSAENLSAENLSAQEASSDITSLEYLLGKVSEDDLDQMMDAISNGADSMAEAYGIERSTLDAMCQTGYSMYEVGRYQEAASMLSLIITLDQFHVPALRGLGAVLLATKRYGRAAFFFSLGKGASTAMGKVDIPCQVLLGECMLLSTNKEDGVEEEGMELLQEAVDQGSHDLADIPYIKRAQTIIRAGGQLPPPLIFVKGDTPVGRPSLALEDGGEPDPFTTEAREITAEDLRKIPEIREVMDDVMQAIQKGHLTFGDVGGFKREEIDGIFAVASQYAQQEEYENAVLIISFLFVLDGAKPRYYLFMASIMQRMGKYETAESMYDDMAPNMLDNPLFNLNRGETKIMLGKVDEGRQYLDRCLELGDNSDDTIRRYHKRARRLLKMGQQAGAATKEDAR